MTRLNSSRQAQGKTNHWRALLLAGSSLLWTLGASSAAADVSQTPLLLGGGNVPGNLALVPSVEWPTLLSVANTGNYSSTNIYLGYFDSAKCYVYDVTNEWFVPEGYATAQKCGGSRQWSGNFLNWAGTPTIDPFRSALTGGYRYKDEVGLTVLEKARHTGQSTAGDRTSVENVPRAEIVGATPAGTNWENFYLRLNRLGVDMLFSNWNNKLGDDNTSRSEQMPYPSGSAYWENGRLKPKTGSGNTLKSVFRLKIRVKVCVPTMLEANCKQYENNSYKPEGLLQQYNESIRYSVFGYLNDGSQLRDGGVLRAGQKYIGPLKRERGVAGQTNNARAEWDKNTGILFTNPNPADATATQTAFGLTVSNSGVINYLNKFGQLTNYDHKSNDPVSELYYAAFRYFRHPTDANGNSVGNVPEYSTPSPAHTMISGDTKDKWLDGFPVITDWDDPIQYACQKNVILGIGDTNTHADRNLPHATKSDKEPATPARVAADSFNVSDATARVGIIEGVDVKATSADTFGDCCSNNSAYIAGMAYHANTVDLRDDIIGKQLLSTHWVDVREGEKLKGRAKNQYWLAAKYGGFKVPEKVEFGDPYARTEALPNSWWTDGDLTEAKELRPRNFYVASDATKMVESLKTAFANIAKEVSSTTAALSTNSTRLDTGTAVFQSLLDSADWSGDLLAKAVATDGTVATTPSWRAASKLDALTNDQALTRDIFTSAPPTTDIDTGAVRSTTGSPFTWAGLTEEQKLALRATAGGTLVTETLGQQRLEFIKGDRSQERTDAKPNLPFRERASRLGDIANSDPQYIHKPNFGYAQLPASAGFTTSTAAAYTTFRNTTTYKNRPPLVVVGANDGMLHGFNASLEGAGAGTELFAYVPNDVIDDLYELTEPTYAHRYYVDGTARLGDAWVDGAWKTLAIGSTGAGGRSIFALDITDPGNMTADSVLWEFTHPEMGYTLGRPSLVPLPNGKFGVIVTSGYERSTETTAGYVWVLDAADGSILRQFDLPNSGDLGAPLAVDLDNDRVTDRIYIGDTQGNVWRLDIEGSSATGWDAPSALKSANAITPLFIALDRNGVRQPITAPLDAAYTKDRDIMLVFGTGSFYKTTDNEIPASPQVQSFYGIIDGGSQISGRSSLLEQEILIERSGTKLNGRGISQREMSDSHKGWYLDLVLKGGNAKGERVISQAQLGGNRVTFSSLIPSDNPCDAGGRSWIMSLDLSTGGRLAYSYFDYNGDGTIDQRDYIQLEDGTKIPVSGISDPDDGAVKGTIGLNDRKTGKRYLCYASSAASVGSNGVTPVCIEVMGDNNDSNRLSWHEVRQ
ncbi:pilus assembly protein [Stutzerimonas urumqiensis]|uniref:pilus assembly protein n=1 Tax=Stutzerimonas urumqiensis TaxID=638269 RepID=UPI000EAE17FD|nr:PilC/PilY family type IV pilus protein [Stutzerimonas urumqiensis]